ncbi:hypothetical protein BKA56DRAFT_624899 [Ilyonectria sp. MPI-CAGE-AT-0026]|nr:hypothetical protein BKA56DRAFT_624899 [Ilyonectria sp. MPI-CAGE-AT-0026]
MDEFVPKTACTNEGHEQTEAIKEMVRETQSSVEALRAALGSRKGGQTRRVGRISASKRKKGKSETRQKNSPGSRANRGPAQGAAGAIGQGVGQRIGQKAMSCTALPGRQRERSPENVKDTDRNSLHKAPGAPKEPSLPARRGARSNPMPKLPMLAVLRLRQRRELTVLSVADSKATAQSSIMEKGNLLRFENLMLRAEG